MSSNGIASSVRCIFGPSPETGQGHKVSSDSTDGGATGAHSTADIAAFELENQKYEKFFNAVGASDRSGAPEELRTTPLLSLSVKHITDKTPNSASTDEFSTNASSQDTSNEKTTQSFPQYALLGQCSEDIDGCHEGEKILLNTRVPASVFICGQQGSGKSYTLSCMLESYIKPTARLGQIGNALAGLVFHYDIDGSAGAAEAAGLCSLGIKTKVIVPATNITQLTEKYKAVPGAKRNLTVVPFYLKGSHLTVERISKLMSFEPGANVPLYASVMVNELRSMALASPGAPIDYQQFKRRLEDKCFNKGQNEMLQLRLDLLDSFISSKSKNKGQDLFSNIEPGTLTIIDLSCPLVDKASARVLMDISLGLVKEHRPTAGLAIAVDEAHKFIDDVEGGVSSFTERLMTTIREQRHVGARVIVATQEPTVSTKLLDLCSMSIVHRFYSPAWLAAIEQHLGAAKLKKMETAGKEAGVGLMNRIMALHVGESLVFAPSSFVCMKEGKPKTLKTGILKMRTRRRMGADQGLSQLADG